MNFFPNDDEMEETQSEPEAEGAGEEQPDAEEGASEDEKQSSEVEGARLILKRAGQETDIVFGFSAPATIGRFDPEVGPIDVDLGSVDEGSFVSRTHARIVFEDDVYKIQDLGSSNGTYILRDDFEKVEEAELKDGDEISFGNARFVFRV